MESGAEGSSPSSIVHPPSSFVRTVLWAVYLGMSWTWCIGMFLPVLLVRDYGVWGWVVFAVPNVIGAAAMGFALRDGQSEGIVAQHGPALRAFSIVTIAFQTFFAGWMLRILSPHGNLLWLTVIVLTFAIAVVAAGKTWRAQALALAALTISVGCFLQADRSGQLISIANLGWNAGKGSSSLIPLALVCLFGFAFCPYGDLTFHRARQSLNKAQSRLAFAVGFGVVFLSMIVFTLFYASMLEVRLQWDPNKANEAFLLALQVHFVVQLSLTAGLHAYECSRKHLLALLAVSVGVLAALSADKLPWRHYDRNEFVYRLFMSFYGLVFPAYVWLCMIPTWRDPLKPSVRSLVVFAIAVLAAAPFYWLGFIEQRMFWLLPGLGIVLLARLAVPRGPVIA